MKRLLTSIAFLGLILTGANAQQTEANFTADTVCIGEPTTLNGSISTVHPQDSIVLYAWDLDGDLSFDDAVGDIITFVFPGPNYDHNVGLKITTKFNVTKSVYYQVYTDNVTADFSWVNTCLGDITEFTNLSSSQTGGIIEYIYVFDTSGQVASFLENPTYTYADDKGYVAELRVTTEFGCTDNVYHLININPVPSLYLTYNFEPIDLNAPLLEFTFYEGEVLEVTANILGAYADVSWSDGQNGLTAAFTVAGDYSVTVTSDDGCFSTAYFNIRTTLQNDLEPTTVITPNADGYNDYWFIKPVILPGESYEVMIYNRWGDEVYANPNYTNNWDGTYEGNPLPQGAYYYIVKNNDNTDQILKGAINILVR